MKRLFILFAFNFLLFSCSSEVQLEQAEAPDSTFKYHETAHKPDHSTADPFEGKEFKTQAFQNADLSWGYKIAVDGKQIINQPHIPGLSGETGFKTKAQALKTADFVIDKIKHHSFPPSVSAKELDSLGVLK